MSVCLLGFPCDAAVKNPPANVGDSGDSNSISGLGRCPGGRHGKALQYSYLGNPVDRGSLAGYSPWGCKESDLAERLSMHVHLCLQFHSMQYIDERILEWIQNTEHWSG